MSIKTQIWDPVSGHRAEVVDGDKEKYALVVATRPLKTFSNKQQFFLNEYYGSAMNQNAAAGGTPLRVHNGTDDTLWTGTNIIDTVDFDDSAYAYEGSYSLGFDAWSNSGDLCQIAKGSDQSLVGYVSLSMWIYIRGSWSGGDSIGVYGWDTGTSSQVGTKGLLEDYVDWTVTRVWQKIVIPLSDMGLVNKTIDSIRFRYEARSGTAANFYLDNIQFEETGTPILYEIIPATGTWLYVENFMLSIANNITSVVSDGTLPGLAYNSFLGEYMAAGITYQRLRDGVVTASATIRTLADWLSLPETIISSNMSDGTNTYISMQGNFTDTIILKSENEDKLRILVNDDLSGLLHFKISAGCKEEDRSVS